MKELTKEPMSPRARKLSERLNRLFDVVHPPDRGPYSNAEVAELMAARGLETVTSTYLWMLRTGRRDNPTMRHLEALATFSVFLPPTGSTMKSPKRLRRS